MAVAAGYHRRENAKTKTPPADPWEANGFLPRMPDSLEQLDLLLMQVAKARQVRTDGIHFQSLRHISTTLAAYVGETVSLQCARLAITWKKNQRSTYDDDLRTTPEEAPKTAVPPAIVAA